MPSRGVDVYGPLREALVRGEFRPNEPLREEAIAGQFGVSRTPVREALARLAAQGLVVIEKGAGARVANLSPDELAEVFSIRIALESLALHRACSTPDPEGVERLRANYDASKDALARGDRERLTTLMIDFHVEFTRMASPRLEAMAALVRDQTLAFGAMAMYDETEQQIAVAEHAEFLMLIESRRPRSAIELLHLHMNRPMEAIEFSLRAEDHSAQTAPAMSRLRAVEAVLPKY